jgi:hypothetical protein
LGQLSDRTVHRELARRQRFVTSGRKQLGDDWPKLTIPRVGNRRPDSLAAFSADSSNELDHVDSSAVESDDVKPDVRGFAWKNGVDDSRPPGSGPVLMHDPPTNLNLSSLK